MFTNILKTQRVKLGLKIQEISSLTGIDQGLLSKYESGKRNPSEKHVLALADGYKIPLRILKKEIIIDKIAELIQYETDFLEILHVAESRVEYLLKDNALILPELSAKVTEQLFLVDELKAKWQKSKPLNKTQLIKMQEYFALKYTYDSNRIEGNTLTLAETQLVINEGVTISGKSMREHLEAINHSEAISFIEDIINQNETINNRFLLDVHSLVLKSIDSANAGKYRNVPVMISGTSFLPPQPILLDKLMEDYFIHYRKQKRGLHPVILAAEMHERLVSIHPFLDGNGRTSRLIMNFILLQNGYTISILKGDNDSKIKYYNALLEVQINNNPEPFYLLLIERCIASLEEHLNLV